MKLTRLIHNPGAGEEAHNKKELLSILESEGFGCRYASTKKEGWQKIEPDIDLLIVAGGDGTVGKVAKELLDQHYPKKIPIALLPLGTANNIANALGITGTTEEIVRSWHTARIKNYDTAKVESLSGSTCILEGFGFGVFPRLMKEMKKLEKRPATPAEELQVAMDTLHAITLSYESRYCRLELDGQDHSGRFLLVEIMNTPSIGPNLLLAPTADPGDGVLDIVLIPETEREKLAEYIHHKITDAEVPFPFKTITASKILLQWEGTHLHVDDELIKQEKPALIQIEVNESMLEFLVPAT